MEEIDAEILEQLYRLEKGQLSVAEFEAWHVGRTWNERSELTGEIDFVLIEKHLLTEEQLRTGLLACLSKEELQAVPTRT